MKKILHFFSKKRTSRLEEYASFELDKQESDTVFGGFKEYKPPIYEQHDSTEQTFRTIDLLTDIHQPS